jgi:molybdopterin converting factor small subunit
MEVTVHYLAQLRRAAGCASERLDVEPGLTVASLFHRLANAHGDSFRTLLFGSHDRPHAALLVFLGDQPAEPSSALYDSAEVTILTPMAGG